ncbi:MAG: hypothetical protein DI565_01390 [Ancylobacter novellus]|uniref:PIN domain-containing protein n=1 Tax=Ancylobacter novellus TaxID=921 RepID=A0A2W5MN17_ANCNO|nr:MAG: hypothetical protein DI565_01390 [Ancylobacter novellus]
MVDFQAARRTIGVKFFMDTNILLYTLDRNDPRKAQKASAIVRDLSPRNALVISLQVLNEMTNILLNKRADLAHGSVREIIESLVPLGDRPLSWEIIEVGWAVRALTGYGWWDSLLVATAHLEKCDYFLSEDMQHERTVMGVTILNPFLTSPLDLPFPN